MASLQFSSGFAQLGTLLFSRIPFPQTNLRRAD